MGLSNACPLVSRWLAQGPVQAPPAAAVWPSCLPLVGSGACSCQLMWLAFVLIRCPPCAVQGCMLRPCLCWRATPPTHPRAQPPWCTTSKPTSTSSLARWVVCVCVCVCVCGEARPEEAPTMTGRSGACTRHLMLQQLRAILQTLPYTHTRTQHHRRTRTLAPASAGGGGAAVPGCRRRRAAALRLPSSLGGAGHLAACSRAGTWRRQVRFLPVCQSLCGLTRLCVCVFVLCCSFCLHIRPFCVALMSGRSSGRLPVCVCEYAQQGLGPLGVPMQR